VNQRESTRLSADQAAQLYAQHAASLLRFLTGLTGSADDAQDCLQATFAILQEKGGASAAGTRRAWLFRVAHNEAMQLFRRRKLAGPMESAEELQHASAGHDSPVDRLLRQERLQRVRRELAQLPEELQVIVRLRIVEGLRFREIADQLQIPLGTALGRMQTALRKLGQQLGEDL